MAKRRRIRWDRVIVVFGPILLLILILCVCCGHKSNTEPGTQEPGTSTTQNPSGSDIIMSTTTDVSGMAVPVQAEPDELIVVIDPGHGGVDDGATNKEVTRFEKDDNLRLALATRDAFNRKYPDVRVIMTRETDDFISLDDRCAIANNANADFYISLHRNSAETGSGIEIWINNSAGGDNSVDSLLAHYIMEWLEQVGISKNRGIKSGFRNSESNGGTNYYVNLNTHMPSCLVEMGFMTSDADNKNFDEHCDAYGNAIASAVMEMISDRNMFAEETTTSAETTATITTTKGTETTIGIN